MTETSRSFLFSFVNDINARGGQCTGKHIFPIEHLVQAEAGADGTDNRNERVVDSNLADGVASEQFVVERETHCADADEQEKPKQPQHCKSRQRTSGDEAAGHKDNASDGQAVACADEDIDPFAKTTDKQRSCGTAEGVEDDHAIA